MYGGGASAVQPRAWRAFVEHLAPEERDTVLESYYRRLQSADAAVRDAAVRNMSASLPLDPAAATIYGDVFTSWTASFALGF